MSTTESNDGSKRRRIAMKGVRDGGIRSGALSEHGEREVELSFPHPDYPDWMVEAIIRAGPEVGPMRIVEIRFLPKRKRSVWPEYEPDAPGIALPARAQVLPHSVIYDMMNRILDDAELIRKIAAEQTGDDLSTEWIEQLRELVRVPATGSRPRSKANTEEYWSEFVEVFTNSPSKPGLALAAHFDITHDHARHQVARARREGRLPPSPRAKKRKGG